jgi:superfamily II DNA/RNA helicase
MDKQTFLETTYHSLDELHSDQNFRNNLSQVRARAIQQEFVPEQSTTQFTFDTKRIWQSCNYLFSESALLLNENFGDRTALLQNIRTAAQAFEFLYKIAEPGDQEILLLNAAICYQIAGYQANAFCISKFIEANFLNQERGTPSTEKTRDAALVSFFRQALIKFLRREVRHVQDISTQALKQINASQTAITQQATQEGFPLNDVFALTAHAFFHRSLGDFVQYCLSGNLEFLDTSKGKLQKSQQNFVKAGDSTLGVVVSELTTSLDLFRERSTWGSVREYARDLLQDSVWRFYLRNLALEKSIVEFWPSQLKAIQNHLLTSDDSFVVQMPTSAGKTFIAELAILAALTNRPQSRCLYIAPYRALVNEIQSHLSNVLGKIGYRVSTLIGGFEFDTFQNFLLTQAHVLVITPEKVELLLRTKPGYFEDLTTVIVDEGHMIDEGISAPNELAEGKTLLEELHEQETLGRGVLLEFLMTRLKAKLPQVRFIFLSAVMPEVNAQDFVDWLCERPQEPLLIGQAERPSRQVIAKFEWRSSSNGEIQYLNLPTLPNGRQPWVPSFIQRKQYSTGERTPTGRPHRASWPTIDNKSQTTAMLAARLAKTGPVLVFCAQTSDARTVLNNLVTTLKYLEASDELPGDDLRYVDQPNLASFYEAMEWLGEDHPLTQALHYRVALHYGPLPDAVRQAVEEEFRENYLRILVSTNTLGQGVNLPVKTAVIHSLERRWTEHENNGNLINHTSKVRKRDFWNICGRAGRAGKETEGQVIFVKITPHDEELIQEYQNQSNLEEVDSALFKLLQALVERRISQNDLIGYLDSYILAVLAEEVVNTQDEASISRFLETSLVGVQAIRKNLDCSPLISTIRTVSTWVVNQVEDEQLRKVFASTGLRVASCQFLEISVNQVLEALNQELQTVAEDPLHCSEILIQSAFSACLNLPEMRLLHTINYHGPDNEFSLIANWINGEQIRELRNRFWNPTEGESFSRYLADRVTYKLPWGMNGFLGILAFKLQRQYSALPIAWQHLPAMMKFGVNNVFACWASSLGITSRNLALQLAQAYSSEDSYQNLDYGDFIRWIVNLPNEYIFNDLDVTPFERNKLLKARNRIIIGDESLQFLREETQELESPVRGIPYENNRIVIAARVREGDSLTLEAELDNPYDPNAVRVSFEDQQIGYVQRDKAVAISRELQLGKQVIARASRVRPADQTSRYPQIEMQIRIV